MTKRKTWLLILCIHLFVALIALTRREVVKIRLPNKIAVNTVQLQAPPPKPIVKTKPKPVVKQKKAPRKIVKAAVKKPVRKVLPPPKPLPAPPAPIKKLSIDQEKVDESLKKIIQVMQTHLQLPEFGKVKLKLTLLADGSVKDIHVLSSESVSNQTYLETHLKELAFPPLEQGVFGKNEETFSITFCNTA